FEGAENHPNLLWNRHRDGGRPSRSVWCSHVERTSQRKCRRHTLPEADGAWPKHSGKIWAKSALRESLSLDNRGPHKGSASLCHEKWYEVVCGPRRAFMASPTGPRSGTRRLPP